MNADHIIWKTNAWKDPGMVANYAARMNDPAGFSLMKNRVEPEIFQKYVHGSAVLDVGVGTGRASLPLAKMGYDVTGVDSSEAMLRKAAEFAREQGLSMTLLRGDVAALDFRDASFDTVMALNTIAHFPHWRDILKEWTRALRPGGRLIFDVFSMDHDAAYAEAIGKDASWGIEHFEPTHVSEYYLRLGVDELALSLDDLGLSVQAIVPYSAFFGSGGFNRFLKGSPVEGHSWNRLLSWIASDPALYDFFVFLEQGLVANLTSVAACRYMVVLDKVSDAQKNRDWMRRNAEYNAALKRGLSLPVMTQYSGLNSRSFSATLNKFMSHPPNRAALGLILFANIAWDWPIDLAGFLDRPYLEEVAEFLRRARLESALVSMLHRLHEDPRTAEAFCYKGVRIGSTFEYDAICEILDKACHAFGEPE